MQKFDFYTEVRVSRTAETESSGIADAIGVIMGISQGPLGPSYSVDIDGISHMVTEPDLTSTGRTFTRGDFYDGSSMKVEPQRYGDATEGKLVRHMAWNRTMAGVSVPTQAELGRRIAEARMDTGISQADLAAGVGLERTALVRVEAGERRISATELVSLAEVPGSPVDWFFAEPCGRGEPATRPRCRRLLAAS